MRSLGYRGALAAALGVVLVLFYTSFLTARTYYNPFATALIVILGAFIAVGGLLFSLKWEKKGVPLRLHPLMSRVTGLFPALFSLTIVALSADVVITLYAVSTFGIGFEANRVVASLIRRGELLAWLGQQFTPALLTGVLFFLSRNTYLRAILAFFMLGTLGYALATVLNDALVVYELSFLRV